MNTNKPEAYRYWKDKFGCWEYSDTELKFPAVPAGTNMHPLYDKLTKEQASALQVVLDHYGDDPRVQCLKELLPNASHRE